jgi:hypothetical protein
MRHDFSDLALVAEGIMEGMPLLRLVTGSDINSDIDQAWMRSLLKSIGPDGLYYMPLQGRPWGRLNTAFMDPVWRADGTTTHIDDESITQVTLSASCARAIGTMTLYYLRDNNPM